MVGREIKDLFPRRTSEKGRVLLKVENLSVREPGKQKPVLKDVSFDVRAGEVLGIGGLMGAGRTELLMHIMGIYGQRLSGRSWWKILRCLVTFRRQLSKVDCSWPVKIGSGSVCCCRNPLDSIFHLLR